MQLLKLFLQKIRKSRNRKDKRIDFLNLIRQINIQKKEISGVEVGVLNGDYSKKIHDYFKYLKLNLFLVDMWESTNDFKEYDQKNLDDAYKKVQEYFNKFENVNILRLSSLEASSRFENNSLDFVYIDSNHKYEFVKQDLYIWYDKLKTHGVLFGDDYSRNYGVHRAVSEFSFEKKLIVKFSDNFKQYGLIKS